MGTDPLERLAACTSFDWDAGNTGKNLKHGVTDAESEEIFFREPVVVPSNQSSLNEDRFCALGETRAGRKLFVVYTLRGDAIRIISARPMTRKERSFYDGQGTIQSPQHQQTEHITEKDIQDGKPQPQPRGTKTP